ncbi:unnamed protein product [Adineta steineri]|uniref:Caspase family p20 domain-containing protein n=1 Tax=Adineta steineri TaxID=433720 RepID=A0A818XQK6_9BILA|nr:unnamed protein product [Adineta steineri]CAF3743851.1 unnamed protein product [Adineta steineri]
MASGFTSSKNSIYTKRALLIGNNEHNNNRRRRYCMNDAEDLANKLYSIDFEITVDTNLTYAQMKRKIKTFHDTINPGDLVLFFFAGLGCQWSHLNFLVPVHDDPIKTNTDLEYRTINAQATLEKIMSRRPSAVIFLLDCCRNSFVRESSNSNDLSGMRAVADSFISFACDANEVAFDESTNGRNSIFISHLLQHIGQPNLTIDEIMSDVCGGVMKETNDNQCPFRVSALRRKVYLNEQITNDEPDQMHVAPHNGYSIKKTREFLVKYGPYLRTTLKIAQVLFKLGSFVVPQLDSMSQAASSDVDTILSTFDKQNEMEQQLNLVEKLLDHQWAQSNSTIVRQDKSRGVPLQGPDLREVEKYLDVTDNKRSLGDLYRIVTADGHVRWVCLEHYDDISFNNAMLKYTDQLEAMGEESFLFNHININTEWKQHGVTIAGGNKSGNQLNQLDRPRSIYIDDDHQTIYITDWGNHRIVEWEYGAKTGQIVADRNEYGNRSDQLSGPRDMIVDKTNDSIIISDYGNSRVVRWPRKNDKKGETIISKIDCYGLTMDKNGDLYVSDYAKNEVRRWKQGETEGTIVAGGNGQGNQLNQLHLPTHIFVDEDHSVYVSDLNNHRVMKWMKGAKEGIVVAGGNSEGDSLTQLSNPYGVVVDHLGNVYVADRDNHRIMRWCKGSKEGSIVVGGNGKGEQRNQFNYPRGLSFDVQGNLYVVDCWNHRIQKFDIDLN